jgi:hypothetical protein
VRQLLLPLLRLQLEHVHVQVTVRVIAAPAPIARAVLEPVAPRDWEVQRITPQTPSVTRQMSHAFL